MDSFSKDNKKMYAQDGVNINEESNFSSYAGTICKASYTNSPFVDVIDLSKGQFRGARPFVFKNLPKGIMVEASSDGIGTKGVLIDAAKTYKNAAYDLIAMTASDITRYGGLPLVFINILDVASVGEKGSVVNKAFIDLLDGLGCAAAESNVVILKGETAQMSACIGSEIVNSSTRFNWGGTMIGVYHQDHMITGDTIQEGQVIIALKENGFRCNGISSVRKALSIQFGNEWWNNPDATESITKAAMPSVLYDSYVTSLHGWTEKGFHPEVVIHGVVHLSGGAIHEKLAKDILFSRGLSARLDNLWMPPQIMKECAKWRGLSDEEFYEAWNGGQGMLLIVDKKDADYCIKRASDFSIQAQVAGMITKEKIPQVVIVSKLTKGVEVVYK